MKIIAALITCFNRREKTLACLERLCAQRITCDVAVDVYLTDDGCTDGTPGAVAERFPEVNVIHADGSLFWNRGMHKAWETAAAAKDYDYYLWLNDDTFVCDTMLASLLDLSAGKNDEAIIVGATQSADRSRITYGGRLSDGSVPTPSGEPVRVKTFNGNIVLVPRAVHNRLGNLDYYFTHSKGDFDYGLRAATAGIAVYQCGEVLGKCDAHTAPDKWCDPEISFCSRWRMLHRPNGMPPGETFHLEKRHFGMCKAVFHFCTVYMRCLFPWIWTLRKDK